MVMVFPGFTGPTEGPEAFLARFHDFCQNSTIHEFHEQDHAIEVAGDMAVINFRYEMVYECSDAVQRVVICGCCKSKAEAWLAVWGTTLEPR